MWRKSSRCGANGTCVEARQEPDGEDFQIRDSKFPDMEYVVITKDQLEGFLETLKAL